MGHRLSIACLFQNFYQRTRTFTKITGEIGKRIFWTPGIYSNKEISFFLFFAKTVVAFSRYHRHTRP